MNKLKFKMMILSLVVFAGGPLMAFAQGREASILNDDVAYASIFAGDLSLLLSTVIGIMATFFVFRAAKKMGGGLFGYVLNYIALGMVFIILGTASIFVNNWFSDVWFNVINTVCFAFGYIFIVIGANKLLKGIINT